MTPIVRGNDKDLCVTVYDENGNVKNLTGIVSAAEFTLSRKRGGGALVTKALGGGVAVTDAGNGEVTISLDSDDTNRLGTFAFQLTTSDGSGNDTTITRGYLTIEAK